MEPKYVARVWAVARLSPQLFFLRSESEPASKGRAIFASKNEHDDEVRVAMKIDGNDRRIERDQILKAQALVGDALETTGLDKVLHIQQ